MTGVYLLMYGLHVTPGKMLHDLNFLTEHVTEPSEEDMYNVVTHICVCCSTRLYARTYFILYTHQSLRSCNRQNIEICRCKKRENSNTIVF